MKLPTSQAKPPSVIAGGVFCQAVSDRLGTQPRLSFTEPLHQLAIPDMKARKLLADAIYDPAMLQIIGKVFDAAWDRVAPEVSTRPEAIEAARLKLAEIVLSVRKRGTYQPQQMIEQSVELMLASPTELN